MAMNNLHAECDVNNKTKIFRLEIVFATLYPASRGPSIFLDKSAFPVEHARNLNVTEPCRPRFN